jgi:hypothetical protein
MGVQQSKQTDRNGIDKISESMTLCRTSNDMSISDEVSESTIDRKFLIYNRNNRRSHAVLNIKLRKRTLYLYLEIDREPKLIKTIDLTKSALPIDYLINSISVSVDDRYIGIPEIDPDADRTVLVVYALNNLIQTKRLKFISAVILNPNITVNQIVGSILHQIYLSDREDRIKIVSHDLVDGKSRTLDVRAVAEKIRFSMSGKVIGLYGRDVLSVYSPDLTKIDPSYALIQTTRLVYRDSLTLIDAIVTDSLTAYYVLTDNENIYHCVANLTGTPHNRVVNKTRCPNTDYNSLKLHRIDAREFNDLFVSDLDFYSSDGKLVHLQDLVILIDTIEQDVVIRILAEMTDGEKLESISLLGSYRLDLSSDNRIVRSNDEFLFLQTDRGRTNIHDIKKVVAPLIATGLANLIRNQIVGQIEQNLPNAIILANRIGIDNSSNTMIVRAADERDTTYDVASQIVRYSILISTIYETYDENSNNKSSEPPVYQVTVNSNMTLMDIKSYKVFEGLLDGSIRSSDVVDKIFDHYPKSSYDRYQTTIEILDHIYDYTKFIILDIDLKVEPTLDQIFGLYKKRVALLVAYVCSAIVLDYYNRETDLPHCLSHQQIRMTPDYEVTDGVAVNFYHNFQPFKTVVESHIGLLK